MNGNEVNRRAGRGSISGHLRLLFLGMPCPFSHAPLSALLASGADVAAVAIPASGRAYVVPIAGGLQRSPSAGAESPAPWRRLPPPELPVWGPGDERSIVRLAWQQGIPVLSIGRPGDPSTHAALGAYRPDIIAVACFPWRLPPVLLALPPLGCVNVHPSLLPANRGPEPLFWTFYHGEPVTGVTIHLMDERFDSGDILAQREVAVPEGIAGRELERWCSEMGGDLLVEAVRALAAGTAVPVPQEESQRSYFPRPRAEHLLVTPDRPARWAFSFIRGVVDLGFPITLEVGGERFPVAWALGYDPDGVLNTPLVRRDGDLSVQMTPGVLRLSLRQ